MGQRRSVVRRDTPARATRRRARALVAAAATVALAAGCTSGQEAGPEATPTTAPASAGSTAAPGTVLTLAVYGPQPVTDTYRSLAEQWASTQPATTVEVETYATRGEAMAELARQRAAGDPPDLFLAGVDDLPTLVATDAVRRVDDLLAARQVDFGDGYNRRGLEAFGLDAALQCMPIDVSPLVVYYNPQLVKLDEVNEEGEAVVSQDRGWRLDEFARAAAQPRSPGVRGLYVSPRLDQVAPFVYSGGGSLVDDIDAPTTLSLAEDSSADALQELLTVVRDPGLTFGQPALQRKPALQRFIDGQLGMILGYRDLTGTLRQHPDLIFDVMPMPVLDSSATVGSFTGMCLSAGSDVEEQAADLLVSLIDVEAQDALGATGYVMPTNLTTLDSESFRQTGLRPLHSSVFVRELRDIQPPPVSQDWASVTAVAARQLTQLFYDPLIEPLEERLEAIDTASQPLLTIDTGDPGDDGTGDQQTEPPSDGASPSTDPGATPAPSASPSS